jgi:hypothetical protein
MDYKKSEWRKEREKNFIEAVISFGLIAVATCYFGGHLIVYLIN